MEKPNHLLHFRHRQMMQHSHLTCFEHTSLNEQPSIKPMSPVLMGESFAWRVSEVDLCHSFIMKGKSYLEMRVGKPSGTVASLK
jgi:hypothetical protein